MHLRLRIVDSVMQWHLEESDAADSVIASLVWTTSDVYCTIAAIGAVYAVDIMFALVSLEYILYSTHCNLYDATFFKS